MHPIQICNIINLQVYEFAQICSQCEKGNTLSSKDSYYEGGTYMDINSLTDLQLIPQGTGIYLQSQ